MKIQIKIKFESKADAGRFYDKYPKVITANGRELLIEIELSSLALIMETLKSSYDVTDFHLYFDETEF